jgi:hypothetical protein
MAGWIGVDFDGTLAKYGVGPGVDGQAVPAMLARVRAWIEQGIEVRIVTARAEHPLGVKTVEDWLIDHNLPLLVVTNVKDFGMLQLWDDRAVAVEPNTGRVLGGA